jgi:acid phosphatase (class A)
MNRINRFLLLFITSTWIVSCSSFENQSKPEPVEEVLPGVLKGYLAYEDTPNSLALLPLPPAEGSAALALDQAVSLENLALRGTERWDLAIADASLLFPQAADTFSCALNAPISEHQTPHLYMLLRRSLADAGFSTYAAKGHYQRSRPFVINKQPTCTPATEERLLKSGSYPSGHTAIGWAWALILAEIAPEKTDAILARGMAFGESRMVCNVHWQSDVVMGRTMGSAVVARLHSDSGFLSDIAAAKEEIKLVYGKGVLPVGDCSGDAVADDEPLENPQL